MVAAMKAGPAIAPPTCIGRMGRRAETRGWPATPAGQNAVR